MYLLDTDHPSLLERGGAESRLLQRRLEGIPAGEVAPTIITYEAQMRGWLARVAPARTQENSSRMANRLGTRIRLRLSPITEVRRLACP